MKETFNMILVDVNDMMNDEKNNNKTTLNREVDPTQHHADLDGQSWSSVGPNDSKKNT